MEVVMQQRVILLFLLFVVMAAFYASVSSETVTSVAQRHRAQAEMFNRMDESVLGREESAGDPSGD